MWCIRILMVAIIITQTPNISQSISNKLELNINLTQMLKPHIHTSRGQSRRNETICMTDTRAGMDMTHNENEQNSHPKILSFVKILWT